MKVVLLTHPSPSPATVGPVLDCLSEHDDLVVTGASDFMVRLLVKRRPPALRPRVTTYHLEVPRYSPQGARRQLAALLVGYEGPNEIVLAGDPDPELQAEVMHQAAQHVPPVAVVSDRDFTLARREA